MLLGEYNAPPWRTYSSASHFPAQPVARRPDARLDQPVDESCPLLRTASDLSGHWLAIS